MSNPWYIEDDNFRKAEEEDPDCITIHLSPKAKKVMSVLMWGFFYAMWVGSTEWFIRTQPYCGAPIVRWVQAMAFPFVPGVWVWVIIETLLPCVKCSVKRTTDVYMILAFFGLWIWGS